MIICILYTVPFKSKLTVRCESRFSTWFAILDSCANRESRTSYRESSLAGQKTKDSPMTDFSLILQRHTAVTQRGMVTFAQATVCSKQDQFKLWSEFFFKNICIKLHFLNLSFKYLLQMKTNSVLLAYKQQHVYFVTSNDSWLIRLLGLIKISCNIHVGL